jgi:hypothetical protein
MTLQQTIDIPADRRVLLGLTLPETTPMGHAEVQITITLAPVPKKEEPKLGMFTKEALPILAVLTVLAPSADMSPVE